MSVLHCLEKVDALSILHSLSSGRFASKTFARHLETVKFDTDVETRAYPWYSNAGLIILLRVCFTHTSYHRRCELPWGMCCRIQTTSLTSGRGELFPIPRPSCSSYLNRLRKMTRAWARTRLHCNTRWLQGELVRSVVVHRQTWQLPSAMRKSHRSAIAAVSRDGEAAAIHPEW